MYAKFGKWLECGSGVGGFGSFESIWSVNIVGVHY